MSRKLLIASAIMAALPAVLRADQPAPAPAPPIMTVTTNENGNAFMFQPVQVDPSLVRRSMQARAEYDRLTRDINARRAKLYAENPEISAMQQQMRELQEKIDAIMADDTELKRLNEEYQQISPDLPSGARPFPIGPPAPAQQPGQARPPAGKP